MTSRAIGSPEGSPQSRASHDGCEPKPGLGVAGSDTLLRVRTLADASGGEPETDLGVRFVTVSWMTLQLIIAQHPFPRRGRWIRWWVDRTLDELQQLPPLLGESPAAKVAAAQVRLLHSVSRWREESGSADLVEAGVIVGIAVPFGLPSAADLGYPQRSWERVVLAVRHRLRRDRDGPEE